MYSWKTIIYLEPGNNKKKLLKHHKAVLNKKTGFYEVNSWFSPWMTKLKDATIEAYKVEGDKELLVSSYAISDLSCMLNLVTKENRVYTDPNFSLVRDGVERRKNLQELIKCFEDKYNHNAKNEKDKQDNDYIRWVISSLKEESYSPWSFFY